MFQNVARLKEMMAADRAANKKPLMVMASAGSSANSICMDFASFSILLPWGRVVVQIEFALFLIVDGLDWLFVRLGWPLFSTLHCKLFFLDDQT